MASSTSSTNTSSTLRSNLAAFHNNLSAGNFSANAPLIAEDYYWNYNGNIILTRTGGAATLEAFVTSALNGLQAQDIYNILDVKQGKGAVLFSISGSQSGEFVGLPLQEGRGMGRYGVRSGEMFEFNEEAEARSVVTVTPIQIMKEQMQGRVEVPGNLTQPLALNESGKKSEEYEDRLRQTLASIHLKTNAGELDGIADLATDSVDVDENGEMSRGREAFVKLVTSQNAGLGAFPDKLFHDFDVLVDGSFGAVSYVWQAPQVKKYEDVDTKTGAMARVRGMTFFEFDDEGLVSKATGVYDEGIVYASLTGTGGWLYP